MSRSSEEEHLQKEAFGWSATDPSGILSPFRFTRRKNGEYDVTIKILFCGICHSDLHVVKNEWKSTRYPVVPGHEITGVITEVGCKVTKFKVGNNAGVGCMVGSCNTCHLCNKSLENYCPKMILTYNSTHLDGTKTYGGYSDHIVVDHRFAVLIPSELPLAGGAPLLCAGITVYSPIKRFGLYQEGMNLGVVGLGGLGHIAVKFAKALGLKVTVISTSESKKEEAMERLAADDFIASHDSEKMKAAMGSLDGIIDTVSAHHSLVPLLSLLKFEGKLILVGGPDKPLEIPSFPLIRGRKLVAGSMIGGMEETQEMINFAAKHGITADIELIPIDYINTAMDRLAKADIRYRFVIDIANSLKSY